MALTLPDIALSRKSTLLEKPRLKTVQFGDGFVQVAADGLNYIERTFEAHWQARPLSELEQLTAFFKARGGVEPFLFRVPGELWRTRWRCSKWKGPKRLSAKYGDLSATFVGDFSVG